MLIFISLRLLLCIRRDFLFKKLYILLLLHVAVGLSAQEEPVRNAIGLRFENDMFNRMDWYFSNGNIISFYHSVFEKSPVNHILLPVRAREPDVVYFGFRLRQEIYTPRDLNTDEIQAGDHPYAATLSLVEEKIVNRFENGIRFTSTLQLGIIGPAALGLNAQEFIHLITPSDPPQGWSNQVGNDLMLNYSLKVDKEILRDEFSQFALQGKARLGTVYTDATTGFWVRFEHLPRFFRSIAPDPLRRANFYAGMGAEIRVVGYDASLQGGIFNRTSPYTIPSGDVNRLVVGLNAEVVLEIERHVLSVSQSVTGPRFRQADWHAWVGIGYNYWF